MVKNTLKLGIMLVLAYVWLPISGIDDMFVIPFIIEKIGLQMYLLISAIIIIYLYNIIEGKTLSDKLNTIKREIKSLTR